MRFEISIENSKQLRIPYNYQYYLASAFLNRVKDSLQKPDQMKPYAFSNIICEKPFQTNDKGIVFHTGKIQYCTPHKEVSETLQTAIRTDPSFHIDGKNGFRFFSVKKIPISPTKKMRIKTTSPIYLKTKRKLDEELKEYDLLPNEGKWYENLKNNLFKRYKEFVGEEPDSNFYVKVTWMKPKRTKIKNCWRRCAHAILEVEATKKMNRFILNSGLGEKTGMGFGCVEVHK